MLRTDGHGQLLKGFMNSIKDSTYSDRETIRLAWEPLQKAGIDINSVVEFELTKKDEGKDNRYNSLHVAIVAGNLGAVEALIELGADLNVYADLQASSGAHYHPLRLALDNRKYYVAEYLVERRELLADVPKFQSRGESGMLTDKNGEKEVQAVEGKGTVGSLLQHYIATRQEPQALFLVKHGANLDRGEPSPQDIQHIKAELAERQTNKKDVVAEITPQNAKSYLPSLCLEAYANGLYSVVVAMLDRDPRLADEQYPAAHQWAGDTMLHRAILENDPKMVKMLLEHGANPNALNAKGQTPVVALLCRTDINTQYLEAAKEMARHLILYQASQGEVPATNVARQEASNKKLWDAVNTMVHAASCLQSAFAYPAKIDAIITQIRKDYETNKDNILAALMNSKVNFFGSIVSIDKTKDTTEMQAVRAKYTALFKKVLREHPEDKIKDKDTYFNVLDEAFTGMLPKLDASVTDIEQLAPFFNEIKEIVAGLDGAIREILFGTYQDDLFLFSTMVFRFLQQKPAEFSVGRELLVRRIFKWFPADQYSELYQEEKATPPAVVTTTQTTVPDNGESARVQEQQAAASIGAGEPEVVANQPQPKEKEKRTDTPHQVTSALAVAAKAAGRRGQPTTSTTHTVPHGQDTLPALPERNLTPLPQQLEKPEDGDDSKKGPPPLPARNADTSTTTTTTTSTDSNPDMEAARANVEKPGMGSNLLADIQKGTTLMPKEERDAKLQAAAERKKAAGKLSSSNGKEAKSMQDVIAEAMLARRDKLEEEKQKKLTPEQQAANGGRASPNEWVDEDPDDDQGSSEKPGPGQRT